MKASAYNENTGQLEIPVHALKAGVARARKQGHVRLAIKPGEASGQQTLDLSPLQDFSDLESLAFCEELNLKKSDLSPLYECERLEHLACVYRADRLDFSRLSSLKSLYLLRGSDALESLALPALQHLLLVSPRNVDCRFLSTLALQELRISGGQMQSLKGLEKLAQLRSLELDHSSKLTDISSINDAVRLEQLSIEKCKYLTDFAFLAQHPRLDKIFISELESLGFVTGMRHLSSIRFWDVKDGDLTPLLQSETLRHVDFYPQRKSYSHKLEEILNRISNIAAHRPSGETPHGTD